MHFTCPSPPVSDERREQDMNINNAVNDAVSSASEKRGVEVCTTKSLGYVLGSIPGINETGYSLALNVSNKGICDGDFFLHLFFIHPLFPQVG